SRDIVGHDLAHDDRGQLVAALGGGVRGVGRRDRGGKRKQETLASHRESSIVKLRNARRRVGNARRIDEKRIPLEKKSADERTGVVPARDREEFPMPTREASVSKPIASPR